MPLLHGRSVGQFDTEPARYPLQAQSGSCRRTCVTLHRPASRRSPKGVGPESFSAPERVDRAGDLVQPGVQPGLGLAVSLSGRRDSNPRRPAWEAGILPLNYARVREGRGTINRDIQNCLGRIGLNLLRPVNLTFARSISNIGFEVRAVRRSCLAKPPGVLNPLALGGQLSQRLCRCSRSQEPSTAVDVEGITDIDDLTTTVRDMDDKRR